MNISLNYTPTKANPTKYGRLIPEIWKGLRFVLLTLKSTKNVDVIFNYSQYININFIFGSEMDISPNYAPNKTIPTKIGRFTPKIWQGLRFVHGGGRVQ